MKQIIDKRGSGKSSRLLLMAKQYGATVVCHYPSRMKEKALIYGITGVDFIDYETFLTQPKNEYITYYIDDISDFLKFIHTGIIGYSDSIDEGGLC